MSRGLVIAVSCVSIVVVPTAARAWLYAGNPPLTWRVVGVGGTLTGGVAHLDGVRTVDCDTDEVNHVVDATFDPTDGGTLTIAGGDLCAAVFDWGSAIVLDGVNGSGSYSIACDPPSVVVDLDAEVPPDAPLGSCEVLSGSPSGGLPKLRVRIND